MFFFSLFLVIYNFLTLIINIINLYHENNFFCDGRSRGCPGCVRSVKYGHGVRFESGQRAWRTAKPT